MSELCKIKSTATQFHPLEIQPYIVSLMHFLRHSAVVIRRSSGRGLVLKSACESVRISPAVNGAPTPGNGSNDGAGIRKTNAIDLKTLLQKGGGIAAATLAESDWLAGVPSETDWVLHDLSL